MARRDARRYKGRSALVFAMLAVPVALLVAALCWVTIGDVRGEGLIRSQMGDGQALLYEPQPSRVAQVPEGNSWDVLDTAAKPVPGYVAGRQGAGALKRNTAALQRLVGGVLVPVAEEEVRLVTGERRIRIHGLIVDGRQVDLGAKARLISGRWPRDRTEVLVTAQGFDKGMPAKGTFVVSSGAVERELHVVGSAAALGGFGAPPDFVTPGRFGPEAALGPEAWILLRDAPVFWPEVRALNDDGIAVVSAAVVRDPPGRSELDPSVVSQLDRERSDTLQFSALGAVALFLVVTLLVAPAFAVGASRQRRTLALAACNGAESRQLRRSVLAQGVVLGLAATLCGAAVGAGGVKAGVGVWRFTHPYTALGSFATPWLAVGIVVGCAAASALCAALLPALRLARLDVVGVVRGGRASPPPSRRLRALGALLLLGGGALLVFSMWAGLDELASAVGAAALVLGALLVVPAALAAAGVLATRLPAAARMAVRDAARHRARSVPTVAAILAGVAVLTTLSIAAMSDDENQSRHYVPRTLEGEGLVEWLAGGTKATGNVERLVARTLDRVAPSAVRTPIFVVRRRDEQPEPDVARPFVVAVQPGSTVEASLTGQREGIEGTFSTEWSARGQIVALPIGELTRRLRLDPWQRRVLEHGGVATIHTGLIHDGALDVASGTYREDPQTGRPRDVVVGDRMSMPAIALPASVERNGALVNLDTGTGAVVSVATARRLGWPLVDAGILLRDPDGRAVDPDLPQTLDEYVTDDARGYVEQGFTRDESVIVVAFAIVAVLLVAVTLIATALSLAEQQSDMGTLAAVGATRGTRRRLAAALAIVVGLIGAVLGAAVGLFAGVAVAHPLTATAWDYTTGVGLEVASDPVVVVPWLLLLAVVLGVPLLAGALAAAAVRRSPKMTRRAD